MTLTATAISMGNPHLVLFVDEDPPGTTWGTSARRSSATSVPEGTNVEFARVDGDRIDVRVWERGAGRRWPAGAVRARSPSRRTRPG